MPDSLVPRISAPLLPASHRFSGAANHYDQHAHIQKSAAAHLGTWLNQLLPEKFEPQICIDVGSGTGFLTQYLLEKFPDSLVHAVDLAPGMLAELKRKYPSEQLHIHQLDGENLQVEHFGIPRQSLIVSGMCAQWFDQLEKTIRCWLSLSNTLALSVLLDGSFQAWHRAHDLTQQACGLRPLPAHAHVQGIVEKLFNEKRVNRMVSHTKKFLAHHPDGLSFARNLRAIGADFPRQNHRPVSLRKVIAALGGGCTMDYHIGFYYLERS